jgi:CHAT domain-containing protein
MNWRWRSANWGKADSAQERVESAINLIESLRARAVAQDLRTYFLSPVREMYETQIALLMERHRLNPNAGYASRALQASERARARGLIELLAESRTDIREGVDPTLLQRERETRLNLEAKVRREIALLNSKGKAEELAAVKTEIARLTEESSRIEARIRAESPRYANLVKPTPLNLAEIQSQVLDERTLLLEYVLGEERSYLFAVTKTGLSSYELPKRAEIELLARRVNELMRISPGLGRTPDDLKAARELEIAAHRLSEMVLRPVADQLSNRRLLIVADGALRYVPFAALPDPGTVSKLASPLIVKHEIASIPSATTLAVLRRELKERPLAPRQLAVLADPVFGVYDDRVSSLAKGKRPATSPATSQSLAELERGIREDGRGLRFPRLPFSREEAEAISRLAPPTDTSKSLDFRASREAAINSSLADYQYIHLATHGLLNGAHPELSGLFFSLVNERGDFQNGLLRVDEIYNLKLPAELIVLSACETALGKDIKGEGIVGLTRGFMYAGARRVVASLWKVNDASTAELMKRFYQGMLGTKKLSPSAALREAQVSMWADKKDKRWQSPYYWAAFVLQGEW